MKRKFADVTTLQENVLETNVEPSTMEDPFMIKDENITETILLGVQNEIQTSSNIPKSPEQNLEETINLDLSESPSISEMNCTTVTPQTTSSIENVCDNDVIESPVETISLIKQDHNNTNALINAILPVEQTPNSVTENQLINNVAALASPTTPSVPKERKRRIIIDDDDESPTFNPQRSNKKLRGKNRRNKQKQKKTQLLSTPSLSFADKTNENAVFTSPEAVVSRRFFCDLSCLFDKMHGLLS